MNCPAAYNISEHGIITDIYGYSGQFSKQLPFLCGCFMPFNIKMNKEPLTTFKMIKKKLNGILQSFFTE